MDSRIFRTRKAYMTYLWFLLFVIVILVYDFSRNMRKEIKVSFNPRNIEGHSSEVMKSLNNAKVDADDPNLIYLLKNFYIRKPSHLPYNLTNQSVVDHSSGQAAYVDRLFNHKTNGFFIECGAFSGERHSNTLFLERYRNWTGILIEANPILFKELTTKNRNAFSLNSCLGSNAYPSEETLFYEDTWTASGNIIGREYSRNGGKGVHIRIQCFSLYSILLALDQLKIDYFSLDIEGAERGVLESIPWTKVDIELFSIEYQFWPGGKESLAKFMEKRGYKFMKDITKGGYDIIVQKQKYNHLWLPLLTLF